MKELVSSEHYHSGTYHNDPGNTAGFSVVWKMAENSKRMYGSYSVSIES